jgi:aminomethyltransferase
VETTPLFDLHQGLSAKFIDFGGWQMPLHYTGILEEHRSVRSRAGVFDVSHMAKWLIRDGAGLQKLVPTDLGALANGQAVYTLLLNPQGGIKDDVIIYRHQDIFTLISNCATYSKVKLWLEEHLGIGVISLDRVLLALQGQDAEQVLQSLVTDDLSKLAPFHHTHTYLEGNGAEIWLARTGYTGEDGFEIMADPDIGRQLWQKLLDRQVVPCGLGCRDTLRLEAGLHLYGQDMDETTNPYEAGLGWTVHLDRVPDFVGRAALLESKMQKKLVGIKMLDRQIPRHGYPVAHGGEIVGTVTSGTLSPTLNLPIGFAYVPPELAKIGQALEVIIRGKPQSAVVCKRQFLKNQGSALPPPTPVVKHKNSDKTP